THMPSCCCRLRALNLNCRRKPISRKIISSRLAICRMTKMATGIDSNSHMLKYMLTSNRPPATSKNGAYGTPRNMGGRVHPRNSTFLCTVVLDGIEQRSGGAGAAGVVQQHAGDLASSTDQQAADQDRSHIGNALVSKSDLIAGEDHRNGH